MTARLVILVVEDEPPIRRFLRTSFAAEGYQMLEAGDARSAIEVLQKEEVDVAIIDLGLPGTDGFGLIQDLRARGCSIPIIVLSSRADETGKVQALDMGADDYVTKPFGTAELIARIRAAIRHSLQQDGERPVFTSGDLTVDLVRRIVMVRGAEIKLTPREYDLLRLLVAHAGKVLTHRFILSEIWGGGSDVQYLRIYIRTLRQKIEATPERPAFILTEQGVGYRLKAADLDSLDSTI